MTKRRGKPAEGKSQPHWSKIRDRLTPADTMTILRRLAEQNAETAQRIEAMAVEMLRAIDVDDIASDVQMELESLQVEDVWDRSGRSRHGYVEPGDAAYEMFEEALEPFQEQLETYKQLSMHREAKLLCMGLLKGIYDFAKESTSEYKDWAMGAPREYFSRVLEDWQKWTANKTDLVAMD